MAVKQMRKKARITPKQKSARRKNMAIARVAKGRGKSKLKRKKTAKEKLELKSWRARAKFIAARV